MLNKNQIIKAEDLKKEKVMTPEWASEGMDEKDAFVFVRCLTGTERDKFESDMIQGRGKSAEVNLKNLRAKLLVLTIVDPNGKRLFTDTEINDLGSKNASVLDRLFDKAQELSGLRKEDVDDLTKNLSATPSEDSATD